MKVRNILKGLEIMKDIDLVMFNGFGFAPIGYALSDLLKLENQSEPIMDDETCVHIEIRNNVATLYGCFEKYIKKVER